MHPACRLFTACLCASLLLPAAWSAAAASSQSDNEAAADGTGYSEADEALYRKRFERLADPASGMGLPVYDTLQDVQGANQPKALVMAKMPRVSSAALERATDYAARMNSTALLVWQDGLIQAARYFGDTTADTPLVSRSLAKPMAAIAVGRAIQEGHIASLDESAATYFLKWEGTPKAAIRVRHLLDMRSGLLRQAPATDIDDVLNRAYLHPRHDEIIINEYPLVHEPGSRYEYSNANLELVAPLIERATGVQYEEWVAGQVLKPLGAAGGQVWMNREGGTAHAGCCWMLPAETWLRLAILLIHDGLADGRRLLPEGFVREMSTATPQNPHAGISVYVAGDYIRGRGAANPELPVGKTLHGEPYLAHDLFLFDGNSNQVIYIVPSARLVVARLGNRPPAGAEWDNAYLINTLLRGLDDEIRARLEPQPLPATQ